MVKLLESVASARSPRPATASRPVEALLGMIAAIRSESVRGRRARTHQSLAEPLGARDMDVLRLMIAGAPNGDIARKSCEQ